MNALGEYFKPQTSGFVTHTFYAKHHLKLRQMLLLAFYKKTTGSFQREGATVLLDET